MPQFNYIIRTKDGVREEGTIEADNINIASEELRSKDCTVVKIDEKETDEYYSSNSVLKYKKMFIGSKAY